MSAPLLRRSAWPRIRRSRRPTAPRRRSGKPCRRPATPPRRSRRASSASASRRLRSTSSTSFGGHQIDSNGRLFHFGLTEAEHEEDDGGDRPASARPSRLVAGDEILAGAVRRRRRRTSSRCAAIAMPRPRRRRRRTRRCCGPPPPSCCAPPRPCPIRSCAKYCARRRLRAAIIDTPWSAAFISYVIRQSGVAPNAFQFANAHRAYIYDAFAASAAELTHEAGDRIYRACPLTTTRPRVGRSDLPAARARARRRQRRGGARAHPGGTRRQRRRALGPAHPLRGGRACRCGGAQDVHHRRQRQSGGHRPEAEPAPRLEVLGRRKRAIAAAPGHWTLPQAAGQSPQRRATPRNARSTTRNGLCCCSCGELPAASEIRAIDFARAFAIVVDRGRGIEGAQLFPARRFAACQDGIAADRGRMFRLASARAWLASPRLAGACDDAAEIAVLPSPVAPWKGAPLARHLRRREAARGRAFADRARRQRRGQIARAARRPAVFLVRRGRSRRPPARGARRSRASARRPGAARSRAKSPCAPTGRRAPSATAGSVWPLRNTWNRATENLFSAWIEKLFDAPLDAAPSWPALHEVLRDRSRNLLFNHLGLGEDEMKIVLRPDCADLPYFLRAYFAFKMGLPFGYSKCSRGGGGTARRRARSGSTFRTPTASARRQPGRAGSTAERQAVGAAAPPRRRAEAAGLAASFGQYLRDRRRRRPFRLGAHGARTTTTPTIIRCR